MMSFLFQTDGDAPVRPRCNGIAKNGRQCRGFAMPGDDYCHQHRASCGLYGDPLAGVVNKLTAQHRRNAKARGISFSLTEKDVYRMIVAANGKCQVTGVPFELEGKRGQTRRPYFPSIDRIDSKRGYTKANTRIVIAAANLAMNEWGESVLHKMAQSMLDTGLLRPPDS